MSVLTEIVYEYGGGLYINLTNRCPCSCTFCVRAQRQGLGTAESLWLEDDPTAEQVIAELEKWDLQRYGELVFCGYGEPFCALDAMLAVCDYARARGLKTRVNTNGLGDFINKKPTAHLLQGRLDTVSVSLNAPDAAGYVRVSRPEFGESAFAELLRFAQECKQYVPTVKFSVVDVITPEEIAACKALAQQLEIPLRVRNFA